MWDLRIFAFYIVCSIVDFVGSCVSRVYCGSLGYCDLLLIWFAVFGF